MILQGHLPAQREFVKFLIFKSQYLYFRDANFFPAKKFTPFLKKFFAMQKPSNFFKKDSKKKILTL
jgi:hypothetical protein